MNPRHTPLSLGNLDLSEMVGGAGRVGGKFEQPQLSEVMGLTALRG